MSFTDRPNELKFFLTSIHLRAATLIMNAEIKRTLIRQLGVIMASSLPVLTFD